jgi:hypothetical protein
LRLRRLFSVHDGAQRRDQRITRNLELAGSNTGLRGPAPRTAHRAVRGSDEPHALRDSHRRRARESGQPHPVLGARTSLATASALPNRGSAPYSRYMTLVDTPQPLSHRVGPRGTGANLRICRKKSQIRGRACPSVGRGGADRADCVRDLELRELEVSKQTAWQSVLPLALRTGWTVDADGERR